MSASRPSEARVSAGRDAAVRIGLGIATIALLVIGLGFRFRADWALQLWPVPEGPLSYLFISSIILAQATALGWTAASMELNYARGGVLGFAAMNAGFVAFAVARRGDFPGTPLGAWIVMCGLMALGGLALFFLGARYPKRDTRPIPALVRWSFLALAIPLAIATVMLLMRAPVVFPWPLKPETSILFGLFYLASITYFFDGWWRPSIGNSLGQLAAFFVYDAVLIPRYLQHWPKTQGSFRISLVIYLAVLFWSALLAIWIWGKYSGESRRQS